MGGRFELVVFDCDGVLVDSEPLANRVLAERLAAAGLPMPLEAVMGEFIGRTREACIAHAEALLGRALPEGFGRDWDAALHEAFARSLRPVEGVMAVLEALEPPYCAASNSGPERLRLSLQAAGLWARFSGRAFSAAEVAHPKPAPDLFLHAALCMGAAPATTAVVEDTPTGVAAGVAAGMTVFAYAGAAHADRAALAAAGGEVFDRMPDLLALLRDS